jgi:hypothetical protein
VNRDLLKNPVSPDLGFGISLGYRVAGEMRLILTGGFLQTCAGGVISSYA